MVRCVIVRIVISMQLALRGSDVPYLVCETIKEVNFVKNEGVMPPLTSVDNSLF